MNPSVEEIESEIMTLLNDFKPNKYRENSKKELKKAEEFGIFMPNTTYIVDTYPSFDHIRIEIKENDMYVFSMCINPEFLKGNRQAIHECANLIHDWMDATDKEKI